jgi:hypothetical protein
MLIGMEAETPARSIVPFFSVVELEKLDRSEVEAKANVPSSTVVVPE